MIKITYLELSQTFDSNKNALFALWRAVVFVVSLHHLESLFDYVLDGYLRKLCQISNSLFNLRNDKVLLKYL